MTTTGLDGSKVGQLPHFLPVGKFRCLHRIRLMDIILIDEYSNFHVFGDKSQTI
jgi:hypothetical protein